MNFPGISEFLIQTLFNSLWQGGIILILVYCIFKIFQKVNSSTKYFILVTAMIFLILSSAGTTILVKNNIKDSESSNVFRTDNYGEPQYSTNNKELEKIKKPVAEVEIKSGANIKKPAASVNQDNINEITGRQTSEFRLFPVFPAKVNNIIFFTWAVIVFIMFARLAVSLVYTLLLKRSSKRLNFAEINPELKNIAEKNMEKYNICISELLNIPATVGFFKPIILIPRYLLDKLNARELYYVLLHEAGHIKRLDTWSNLFQRICEALLFFNPAVYRLGEEIDEERENACDELVVSQIKRRQEYASGLLKIVKNYSKIKKPVLSTGAINSPFKISERIKKIINMGDVMETKKSISTLFISNFAFVLVVILLINITPFFTVIGSGQDMRRNDYINKLISSIQADKEGYIRGMWNIKGYINGELEEYTLQLRNIRGFIKYKNNRYKKIINPVLQEDNLVFKFMNKDSVLCKADFLLEGKDMKGRIEPVNIEGGFSNVIYTAVKLVKMEQLYEEGFLTKEDDKIYPYLGTWDLWGEIDGKREHFSLTITNHFRRKLVLHRISSWRGDVSSGYFGSRKFGITDCVNSAEVDGDTLQFSLTPAGPGAYRTVMVARFVIDGNEITGGWEADNLLCPNHPVYVTGKRRKNDPAIDY